MTEKKYLDANGVKTLWNNVVQKIPTKTSDLTNDSGFLNVTLAAVATSGSYADLSNKPTIPTVNNATLTVQQNGKSAGTFTANASENKTINITVPTKTSELTNDAGFVTDAYSKAEVDSKISSVYRYKGTVANAAALPTSNLTVGDTYNLENSGKNLAWTGTEWDDLGGTFDFSSLSSVALSGSYSDLTGKPSKVSDFENDSGFLTSQDISGKANDADVVHKSGNETVNGTKTFTVAPVSSNGNTTNGFFIKNTAIARNEVPTNIYHSTFRVNDKNDKILGEYCVEKSNSGSSLLNMNVRTDDSNGNQISKSLYLNLKNDGSDVSFHPSSTDEFNLGTSAWKWKDVNTNLLNGKTPAYADDLSDYVTKTDAETWQTNRLKPGSVVFTINPSDWQNGACVKNVGVDAKYYCSLGVPVSTDTTNLANVSNANVIITEHSGSNMTFKCLGSVPTSAITLELTVFYYDVIDKNADYFNITDAEIDAIFG